MKVTEIFEARRNPHLNPKSDFVAEFYYLMHKYKDSLFLSFTYLNKIGVNPKSKFDTPLGVYAYPANYVQRILEESRYNVKHLPFAGDRPYAQFLESRGNGIDFDHYSYHDLEKDLGRLFEYIYGVKMSHQSFEAIVKLRDIKEASKFNTMNPSTLLWTITYVYGNTLKTHHNMDEQRLMYVIEAVLKQNDNDNEKLENNFLLKKLTINWNTILNRIMGYDYVFDNGHGIIYHAEPSQIVFLTNRGYKHIGSYELGKEGADKVSQSYSEMSMSVFLERIMKVIRKDFPDVTIETNTAYNALVYEPIEDYVENRREYESYDDLITHLRGILIKEEITDDEFFNNYGWYKKRDIRRYEVGEIVGKCVTRYIIKNGIDIDDRTDIQRIRQNKSKILSEVYKEIYKEFNIPIDNT